MATPMHYLESDDVAAMYINCAAIDNAPEEAKKYLHEPGGQGDTDYMITTSISIIDYYNIPIPPRAWVAWRNTHPLPYDSQWPPDIRAIPRIKNIDARPEMQAEFKRRGLTPQ
ncbi:hypothetical protein [Rothia nasimurium]|uniref:hypothetical protein n=1 Tax=Rothia nasimurium TaxID=85336 RepID=UPI001F29E82C|nr:hypothetical protein [Rothia nasimurium]